MANDDLEAPDKDKVPLTPEGMAAEWATMSDIVEDDGSEAEANIDRLMNQEEIDTMLGFSIGDDGKGGRNGIQAIVDSGSVTYERLPMLEIIFERLVRLLSTSLRNLFSDNVEVTLEGIRSVRFGDYINSISLPAMLAVFKAEEWDNFGLITIESALTYSVLDTMLGGKRGQAAARVDGRPFTSIEMSLLRRVIGVVLGDAEAAFRPLSPVNFKVDRIESNPRFVSISRPANAAIRVELRFDMEGRGGSLHLLLPYATIEPIRELLLESFMGEKLGRDPIWENHLATEVWQADVAVKCVLHECTMPLKRVMKLEIGDTLMFDARPDSVASLRCGEFIVSEGRIGRVDDKIAVQVVSPLRRSKTTMAAFDTSHLSPAS
ncbi:Flagellar motor switch protein FliM [Bosea sp. 62]|uniref:flagellar motor switch protein FliM n=1 Tax=unclassified Bosea (in: a-proteobacteria) TaxID=2653178 RepID=UPI00125152DD|nr:MULTISPECIES: flagellar motor switch protein FliM [unclassified Bosea (in: a-proteobacteria)]CAD5267392.1 Flagellar motor switch protein FliM [Bosea sp. 46]CAD5269216.1 Flagellar motor switch protein FliM [Bosea sp. 21B]CAD5269412.1 Flagellar motor switch protein FliM [Bosea sp. 7B]VVT62498.1 Flagellar motor switch protein FliM [Bosea sp. EC-HK365B]VXB95364.1 Flagellar motor switch protein FliM [Bosea sp. 29B]